MNERATLSPGMHSAAVAAGPRGLRAPSQNQLLARLPPAEYAALVRELEPVYLLPGSSVCDFGARVTHVYFPTRGVISLGYPDADGETTELALVGREGAIGIAALIDDDRMPHRAFAHTPCAAYRIPVSVLRSRFETGPLQRQLFRYALSLMGQISQTSVCNLRHSLEERMCRILLESTDRWMSNVLPMTHDVIAQLLGARRQGVTEALAVLRCLGLVSHARGTLTILDGVRLQARACECYTAVKTEAERLLARE